MGLETAFAGLAIMQAGSSIAQGIAANNEAKYNASLYEQKVGAIGEAQKIEASKYDRLKRKMLATVSARTARSGIELTGSPLSVLIDNLTQIELDKQIGQYNLEIEKRYTQSAANLTRWQGKQAMQRGYTNAFTSLLQGATNYGMYKYGMNQGGKTSGSSGSSGSFGYDYNSGYGYRGKTNV